MREIIEILFTNSCNKGCRYCVAKSKDTSYSSQQLTINPHGDYRLASGIINIVQLKKWMLYKQSKNNDIQLVVSGGEPTLLRHWVEFLDWCHCNNFAMPIVYTNGSHMADTKESNLKDLLNCQSNPNALVKILLTHHLDTREEHTRDNVEFLKDLGMKFMVKLLTEGKDMRPFGDSLECPYVIEGIRKLYPGDDMEAAKIMSEYNPLSGDSPYKWRWNGYGDLIDRERTKCRETVVFTVDHTGNIFNCHLFDEIVGNIYELGEPSSMQLAWCCYDVETLTEDNWKEKDTRCEIQHYVNIMENLP